MRTTPWLLTIALMAACAPAWARDALRQDGQVVRCESKDGRTRECAVDARGGARLVRRLSRSACVEGESWGALRNAIWVSHGCRAEFIAYPRGRRDRDDVLRDRSPLAPGHVRCESRDGRWNHCDVDIRGGVELARQLSRGRCVRGRSWGTDAGGIWVSGGCRADFAVQSGPPPLARFRCESRDGAPRHCPLDTRAPVRLVRQLSRSPCVEGHSWGQDRRGVWVMHGCRGEFEASGRWAGY